MPKAYIDDEKLGRCWFATLDGESWLGVSPEPDLTESDQLKKLMDGNNRIRAMRLGTRYLKQFGATFV